MPYTGLQNKENTRKPYSGLTGVKYEEPEGVGKKVLNFGKEIAKDAVSTLLVKPAARATEAITRTLAPNSLASKGFEVMADEGQSQKFKGIEIKPQKSIGQGGGKQIAGQALESASWLYGGGKALEVATKLGGKTMIKQLAKEGAISSAAGSVGYQLQDKGKVDLKQTAKDVALGTVLTPLAGYGVNKLFSKTSPKIMNNAINKVDEIEKSVVQIVDNKTGKLEYKVIPKGQLKDFDNLIDNTQTGIAGKEIDGKIYHLTAKTPESMEARGFTNSGVAKLDEIPTTQPKVEQSIIEEPKSQKTGTDYEPDFTFNAEENFKKTDPNYTPTTFKEIKDNYVQLSKSVSTDDLIDISMGKKEVPQGLTKTSIYELTKNRKDLTIEQIKRLKNIAPESEAGLNLVTVKLKEGGIVDNPTDFIQATEKVMKEKVSKSGITSKTINRFLDGLECK